MPLPELPALATTLQALFDTYPTDATDAEPLALESGDERHIVPIQPGQAARLTNLVHNEATTCRNAHSDGNGQCAHCDGLGVTGAHKPTVWIVWHTDGTRPPRACLNEATANKRAETLYHDGKNWNDQDNAQLEWIDCGDHYELEDDGQDTGWRVSPETIELPAHTWTCAFCGEENDDAFRVCPGCCHHRPTPA
ncbi:hypothetical protein [Streptomyces sp. NPDC002215]|uniref:hypothetical protein n=1 Tax=Streptomyces sp. NPDC002215 TaxID=3154412 RepID=UPI0033166848